MAKKATKTKKTGARTKTKNLSAKNAGSVKGGAVRRVGWK
jgi:hypothetical protein